MESVSACWVFWTKCFSSVGYLMLRSHTGQDDAVPDKQSHYSETWALSQVDIFTEGTSETEYVVATGADFNRQLTVPQRGLLISCYRLGCPEQSHLQAPTWKFERCVPW